MHKRFCTVIKRTFVAGECVFVSGLFVYPTKGREASTTFKVSVGNDHLSAKEQNAHPVNYMPEQMIRMLMTQRWWHDTEKSIPTHRLPIKGMCIMHCLNCNGTIHWLHMQRVRERFIIVYECLRSIGRDAEVPTSIGEG
jgi:hypothetical protein